MKLTKKRVINSLFFSQIYSIALSLIILIPFNTEERLTFSTNYL